MVTDIFFVVLGCLAIVLNVFACALMFGYFRRQTQRCWQREQELSQYGYLTERVSELRKQHEDLSRDLFYAEQTIEKADLLREELQRLEAELQRLDDRRAELTHLNDELGKLRDDLDQKTQRKSDLEQAMQLANAKREELEANQRKLVDANDRLQREQDVKQTRVDQLGEQIEALERQRSDLEGRRNELAHQRDQLESRLQTLNQQRWQQFEEYNRAIGELNARREALKKEADQLQEDVHELQTDHHQLEAAVARGRAEHHELQQSVPLLQAKREELQRESQTLESEVSNLGHQKSALKEHVDALREKQKSLEDAKIERKEIEEEVRGLRGDEQRLSKAVDHLRKEREWVMTQTGQATEEQRTADLWTPVFRPQDYEIIKAPVDELEQLSVLQSHLRRCGLRFHRRVLYAFHTALKVNDISPLVVLAGISGTGKSELPRRYAEAMGMHFLNLAVQPRWDSPQDMFGFFNYLDGRYRATELGRALIQMDPYFDRDDRGWTPPENWAQNSLREQMLLVLLDEMNLARIEYYFSDFLSRLEMRRGIDLEQAEYRRKAEIPLEVGRTGTTDSVMRVFVARNVFFVGTMNEDETTQSLSDKVVDRANVLRFGPPTRLTIEPGLGHQ